MSNNTNDGSRQQANNDFNQGYAPANNSTWDAHNRAVYDAEFQRRQQEQYEQQKKTSGGY